MQKQTTGPEQDSDDYGKLCDSLLDLCAGHPHFSVACACAFVINDAIWRCSDDNDERRRVAARIARGITECLEEQLEYFAKRTNLKHH